MPTSKRPHRPMHRKKRKAASKSISYSLDVAFSSATQPLSSDPKQPVFAMGFGFSERPAGLTWQGEGQAAEKVKRYSSFYFTVFDTAQVNAQKVSKIEIDFNSRFTPFLDGHEKPMTNPIITTGDEIASQQGRSAGCNVLGTYSLIGPYTVDGEIPDGTKYKCTVRVTAQNGQVFSVDPEIIVQGDG